jgi:hypothetical protein
MHIFKPSRLLPLLSFFACVTANITPHDIEILTDLTTSLLEELKDENGPPVVVQGQSSNSVGAIGEDDDIEDVRFGNARLRLSLS